MSARGDLCEKHHRICRGCGQKHTIRQIVLMDGNECCPGNGFTRHRTPDPEPPAADGGGGDD